MTLLIAGSFSDVQAVVIGRAVSIDGDLNVSNYNSDVDNDSFPNVDIDQGFHSPDPATGPETFDNGSGAQSGDMFGIARRSPDPRDFEDGGNPLPDPGLPFAMTDDSLSLFTGDTQGIVKGGDVAGASGSVVQPDIAPFFGVVDTVNNIGNDTQVASWTFDLSSETFSGDLRLSVDFAAMGDFESNDVFVFSVSTDGGSNFTPVFEPVFDGDADQDYTLESGTITNLADPMTLQGTNLTNEFTTFNATITGEPSTVIVQFSGVSDGGSEAFAFRNIIIDTEGAGPTNPAGDYNNDGTVDLADYTVWRNNLGASAGTLPNDTDGGTIGTAQYTTWKTNFGMSAGAGAITTSVVPEPNSLLLVAGVSCLGLLAIRRRVQ